MNRVPTFLEIWMLGETGKLRKGVVMVLGAIGIKEDVTGCSLECALISHDAAGTSRIPGEAVVCCTSRLIISDAHRQRSTRLFDTLTHH